MADPLDAFHPVVAQWFRRDFGTPTPPQALGWPLISSGQNTLILAPTGSGKTLAAFLWAINHLVEQHLREALLPGVRILYVSPLKALNNDIERNLKHPLAAIREVAKSQGLHLPLLRTAVRTGDTPAAQRAAMISHPPDILITTPESLYLMLTARRARGMFRTVQYVVVDEIHAICGNKRGVHLSLSLERLQALAEQEIVRIGLSATQRPLDRIAAFLGGREPEGEASRPRHVTVVDAGQKKEMDLQVACPIQDFSMLPQEGVWQELFLHVAGLIRSHRTTLIFVNNRRLAERVAAQLNEILAEESPIGATNLYAVPHPARGDAKGLLPVKTGDDVILAYHGSMSRAAREGMEERLKAGSLRALVATSSLELGIDIGSIDLVIQLQSPKGIARGLQRVGRSGHLVNATSKGRILPTHREDLVESAVVAREMLNHRVEETAVPENCLDVLAQQIVAMVSVEDWNEDDLFRLVRKSYCYRDLSRELYVRVLEMLGGKYTQEAFRELQPRISWDRVHGVLRALPGSGRLAIMNGGTIPDRGYYGVYLEDAKTKIGEVDEEFVHESRSGDTFILGSNVWRMSSIDANRVIVTPAPGQPARMPFWRGEGIGRSYALGCEVGAFRRELAERLDSPGCLAWLEKEFPVDTNAAWNIQEYFRRQAAATGAVPCDRTIVVEASRDEIGDPRLIVHCPYGRRVNGLLSMVLARRVAELTGVEPQTLYNDDGVLLRSPESNGMPLDLFDGLTPGSAEDLVLGELLSSPLFAGQFRQNASRALLMPKSSPRKRTPLWLQRLHAGDLLQIVRRFDDFPIVIETIREVLNDLLDLRHFNELLEGIARGDVAVRTVETEVPSPFSASLLFDFLAVYMYEWDQPKADKQSRYLAVNRELLAEIVDVGSMASMIRPEAIEIVERQLQHLADDSKARSPEELSELLIRLGDLSEDEVAARCAGDGRAMLAQLAKDGRAVLVEFSGGARWVSAEEAGPWNRADPLQKAVALASRFIRSRGPVSSAELAERYGLERDALALLDASIRGDEAMVRGVFRPARQGEGDTEQWCYRPNLERIHRQTISLLRKEITPASAASFTAFLLEWHGMQSPSPASGPDDLQDTLMKLEGYPIPAEAWERDILRRRIRGFDPMHLMRLGSAGRIVWVGGSGGRMKVIFRESLSSLLDPPPDGEGSDLHEPARRILEILRRRGASFLADLRGESRLSLEALTKGIAELFWKGLITNDVFTELQGLRRYSGAESGRPIEPVTLIDPHHNPGKRRMMQSVRRALRETPGWSGRWSTVSASCSPGDDIDRVGIQAALLLQRYGIVAREFHRREDVAPWPLLAMEFQNMEMRGELRRGYFVEGLSGMQYALPAAVEQLRRIHSGQRTHDGVVLVHACDPANPYGAGVGWPLIGMPPEEARIARMPGNYLAFHRGVPVLIVENMGTRLWCNDAADRDLLREAVAQFTGMIKLPAALRPCREIIVEQCNGMKPLQSPLADVLRSLGFSRERNQSMRLDGFA